MTLHYHWTTLCFLAILAQPGCKDKGPWQTRCDTRTNTFSDTAPDLTWGQGIKLFDDVTEISDLNHIHDLTSEDDYYTGIAGGGVAIEDFDLDGDYDIILTGGEAQVAYFINQGNTKFVECAAPAGLAHNADLSVGVSVADFDNDGDKDVLLLNLGPNTLLQNQGDGSFLDITSGSGIEGSHHSSGASWADLDNDGLSDLIIANLADQFSMQDWNLVGQRSQIFRNLGDGRFKQFNDTLPSRDLPIGSTYLAPTLDFDGDHRPDLLLTQEFGMGLQRNQIYQNLGTSNNSVWLEWLNRTETANIQYPNHVMGVALFDFNQDKLPEFFVTNLLDSMTGQEYLYQNKGEFEFEDITDTYKVNGLTKDPEIHLYRTSSWAALNIDYDNDGYDDLYTVYGEHVGRNEAAETTCEVLDTICPNQPNALYRNIDNNYFEELHGTGAEDQGIGRGVAAADINNDGCLDIVSVNQNQPTRLLFGRCDNEHYSLRIDLIGTTSNRDAIGSILTIRSMDSVQTKYITAGATSLHSAQPFGVHIGIGLATQIDQLTVKWPNGMIETFEDIAASKTGSARYTITEGTDIVSSYSTAGISEPK